MGSINNAGQEIDLSEADIQLGAVEVKDGDSDTRLDVELDAAKKAAFVQSESMAQDETLTGGAQKTRISDGTDDAEVNSRTDGKKALEVADDFTSFEAQHLSLLASTDTEITFAQEVRMVRVKNWDASNRVLVKDGAIASDSDAGASRVGVAPATNVPGKDVFVFRTTTIHVRSAGASQVTLEGYF